MEDCEIGSLSIDLDRDQFMRTLIRELTGTLQEIVGLDEASGFISIVGLEIGQQINRLYRDAAQQNSLTRVQVADVLVDLKKRIKGDFFVIEQDDEKIVLGNRACPFGEKVIDRPALCMMTSNVFGSIAAENLGFAKVEIDKTIAEGAPECRIVVHVKLTQAAEEAAGRIYFQSSHED